MQIEKVDILEYNDMINFANSVFHLNFAKKLSWLYNDNPNICQHHHSIRDEKGNFIGLIASIPMTIVNGTDTLEMRGVGTVSAHKKYRGQGIMKTMLLHIADHAKTENVDIMVLNGNRQRYQRYGYVPIGHHMKYTVTSANLKNHNVYDSYTLEKVKDDRYNDQFKALADSEYQHVIRPKCDYIKRLDTWKNNTLAVLKDGEVVGQICYKFNTIVELLLAHKVDIISVLKLFSSTIKSLPIIVNCYGHQQILQNTLDIISENFKSEKCAQIKIVNPRNLVRVLLKTHLLRTKIGDMSVSIHIEGIDTFQCTICDNVCSITDCDDINFDYSYTLEEFSFAVFGMSHSLSAPFRLGYLLGIPNIDQV